MDWQARYEAGDMPWDEGAAHPELVENAPLFTGRVLVPGCGQGHDVRGMSTYDNAVLGLDLAPGAIECARRFPRRGREEYAAGDLFDLAPELRGAFDWVVEHTCFCAIDPAMRPDYARAVAGAIVPGGRLFAIFYLDPASESRPPYGAAVAELDQLFSPAFELEREWTPARTFEGREGRERVRILRRNGVTGI